MLKITIEIPLDDSYDEVIKEVVKNARGYLTLTANRFLLSDRGQLMKPIILESCRGRDFTINIKKIEEKENWSTLYDRDK